MSKKQFIALADKLRESRPARRSNSLRFWSEMVESMADFCASQNPSFDRERWLDYVHEG